MAGIFISYRRSDTEGSAGRLFERCKAHFGAGSVFFDVTDIAPGQDFLEVIAQKIGACNVLLALIGDRWLDAAKRSGERRIDDPEDVVRREIITALRAKIPVIPVLMQSASMPRSEQLPDELAVLSHLNAIELRHTTWDADFARLVEVVGRHVRPTKSPRWTKRRRRWLIGASVAVVLVLALMGRLVWATQIEMPSVVGIPVTAAMTILTANQLKVHVAETNELAHGLVAWVAQQQPVAGTRVFPGSTVELVAPKAPMLPSPPTTPSSANDQKYSQDLLGNWRFVRFNVNQLLIDQIVTFMADGHFSCKGMAVRGSIAAHTR
jgi:hypothetical protein